ncbi:FAD-binding protein [Rhodococcus sp. T2V]|uniref:FAD-binding protein n=1 Tax=Rhodococcus sp. T2V TaxID=3034164 RepID=UPI0023E0DAC8|nr:FAD-binding protein [Rhodococcus sp. T2V]MDF3309697.1 FAD-binding protein [Rhodococcus sp. T2V]
MPGTIVVNSAGERFVDEGRSYNIVGRAMATFDPTTASYPNLPAWLIFGDEMLHKYGSVAFGSLTPDKRWTTSADSLEELATKVGIDPVGLAATVKRFDEDARDGHDSQFGRGDSFYDQFQGDREQLGSVTASLAPIGSPRYYAVRLLLGSLGTKGGPRTDSNARVLDTRQRPISGLYAAGNAASSVMRGAYAGGGSTIGPALTFGYLAGEHAAGSSRTTRDES